MVFSVSGAFIVYNLKKVSEMGTVEQWNSSFQKVDLWATGLETIQNPAETLFVERCSTVPPWPPCEGVDT